MIRLRGLGTIDLRREDGTLIDAVLRQPKRLALLAFLAASPGTGRRRRDIVLATFWPERDESHARSALSGALSFLRRHLGADAVTTLGEEEVGCDPRRIWFDVTEFRSAIGERREHDALALYAGDLLPGLNVPGASGFEEWLHTERSRLRSLAAGAASALADRAMAERQWPDALAHARHAVALAPDDEAMVRQLIELQSAAGDRAGAIRSYDDFARRLHAEYDAEPAAETTALVTRLRQRSASERPPPARHVPVETAPTSASPAHRAGVHARRVALPLAMIGGGAVAALLARGSAEWREPAYTVLADVGGSAPADVDSTLGRLLRAALEQASVLVPLREDEVRQGLATMMRPDPAAIDEATALELAYRGAVRTVVVPELERMGSSYALAVRVLDAESRRVIAAERASAAGEDELIPAIDAVVRRLHRRLGAQRAELEAARPLMDATTSSFDAYRRLVRASQLSGPGREEETRALLREALALDSTFAMAWSRLAQSWANSGNRDSMLAAVDRLERHRDRGSERERLTHSAAIALIRSDYAGALPLYERLVRDYGPAQLNNLGLVLAALGRTRESLRATAEAIGSRRFGPLPAAVGNQRNLLVMLGRVDEARRVTDSLLPHCGSLCAVLEVEQPWFSILQDEWTRAESLAVDHPHPVAHASLLARRGQVRAAEVLLDTASTVRFNVAAAQLLLTLVTGRPWARPPAMARLSSIDSLVWQGVWEAASGDTTVARRHAAGIRRALPGRHRGAAPEMIDALIAARASRWREIVDALAPAAVRGELGRPNHDAWISALPIRWMVANAYDRLGAVDSAVAMYEHALWPGGTHMSSLIARGIAYPFAHRRVAMLEAGRGRADAARRHAIAFRTAFTNPDPELRNLLADVLEDPGAPAERQTPSAPVTDARRPGVDLPAILQGIGWNPSKVGVSRRCIGAGGAGKEVRAPRSPCEATSETGSQVGTIE